MSEEQYDYSSHVMHEKRHRNYNPKCECVGCQDCRVVFSKKCEIHNDGVDE